MLAPTASQCSQLEWRAQVNKKLQKDSGREQGQSLGTFKNKKSINISSIKVRHLDRHTMNMSTDHPGLVLCALDLTRVHHQIKRPVRDSRSSVSTELEQMSGSLTVGGDDEEAPAEVVLGDSHSHMMGGKRTKKKASGGSGAPATIVEHHLIILIAPKIYACAQHASWLTESS